MEISTFLPTSDFMVGSRQLDVNAASPTKLFIGGITRHTTTKQLRDHFSKYGRVLDCVAMRQPDGRPRGFGYVTLDSPAAAQQCLQEPQMVDGRVVDLKPAVPEGQACVKENAGAGCSGSYLACTPWWATDPLQNHRAEGLDCVDLLSRRPHWPAVPAQDSLSALDFTLSAPGAGIAHQAELPKDRSPATATLSPDAPEFIPMLNQVPDMTPTHIAPVSAPVSAGRTRAPLGNLTNIVAKDQPFSMKPLTVSHTVTTSGGFHSWPMHMDDLSDEEIRPDSSLNDDLASSFSTMGESNLEGEGPASPGSSNSSASVQEASGTENIDLNMGTTDLPSIGSALHAKGECKRCNFFPKGRCQNGHNCNFCHFTHVKNKPSRKDKRERQAAWLATKEEEHRMDGSTAQEMNVQTSEHACEQEAAQAVQPEVRGAAHVAMLQQDEQSSVGNQLQHEARSQLQDVDVSSEDGQQTLVCSGLPGFPPLRAMKLPSLLPLPQVSVPLLPPGLSLPPCTTIPVSQPDEEVSPACQTELPQCSTVSGQDWTTVPMGASSALSRRIPVTIPNVSTKQMCTSGTQTSDELVCPACAAEAQKEVVGACEDSVVGGAKANICNAQHGRAWPRDELLRLRSYCEQISAPSTAFAPFQMLTINIGEEM